MASINIALFWLSFNIKNDIPYITYIAAKCDNNDEWSCDQRVTQNVDTNYCPYAEIVVDNEVKWALHTV